MQLAQINIARLKVPADGPELKDFNDAVKPLHALADNSPGFVWRLDSEQSGSDDLLAFEAEGWLVNITVWDSLEPLLRFVRSDAHLAVMRRRREWFDRIETHLALWWVEEGTRPDFATGQAKLALLKRLGPTPAAFTFRHAFEAPDVPDGLVHE